MKSFRLQSEVGLLGEALAKRYVEAKGHFVLALNYYYEKGKRQGEIDIVTEFEGAIHFIEVKTRLFNPKKPLTFPIESQVTRDKIVKLSKTGERFLRATSREHQEYHFDVVTVLYYKQEKKAAIRYLADIFY